MSCDGAHAGPVTCLAVLFSGVSHFSLVAMPVRGMAPP